MFVLPSPTIVVPSPARGGVVFFLMLARVQRTVTIVVRTKKTPSRIHSESIAATRAGERANGAVMGCSIDAVPEPIFGRTMSLCGDCTVICGKGHAEQVPACVVCRNAHS